MSFCWRGMEEVEENEEVEEVEENNHHRLGDEK